MANLGFVPFRLDCMSSEICHTHAALRWTMSNLCASLTVYGSHTVEQYSKWGLTSALYDLILHLRGAECRFLLARTRILFPLLHIVLIRGVHDRVDVILTGRWLRTVYLGHSHVGCGCINWVLESTLHLSILNDIRLPNSYHIKAFVHFRRNYGGTK